MAIVYAEELHIAHLDDGSGPKAPVKISTFEKSHWKIVPHPVQPHVGPKVAELTSVWWLDVSAVFSQATSNAPSKAGRHKVQWRMNLNVAETDNVVVGTEFRAISFRKDEVCFLCISPLKKGFCMWDQSSSSTSFFLLTAFLYVFLLSF